MVSMVSIASASQTALELFYLTYMSSTDDARKQRLGRTLHLATGTGTGILVGRAVGSMT